MMSDKIDESAYTRLIAFGDIHGDSLALSKLIDKIKPNKYDMLVFCGDYINRGPDSKGVIHILLGLNDYTNARFIMGNHDEMLLGALAGGRDNIKFFTKFGKETIDSYNLDFGKRNFPRDHASFFADLEEYVESDNYIFVHASVDPSKEMIQQSSIYLRWKTISSVIKSSVFPHISGKTVICGHESEPGVRRYPATVDNKADVICIDTGCVVHENGWLTAYDVLDHKIYKSID
jgi:serine/threonine protein phosphatase 1